MRSFTACCYMELRHYRDKFLFPIQTSDRLTVTSKPNHKTQFVCFTSPGAILAEYHWNKTVHRLHWFVAPALHRKFPSRLLPCSKLNKLSKSNQILRNHSFLFCAMIKTAEKIMKSSSLLYFQSNFATDNINHHNTSVLLQISTNPNPNHWELRRYVKLSVTISF